ncbi:beta-phosphoglucomutase [Mesobacillus stamsii]|uniref:Beta-phosphoglucomutase n=1 Tax=Mesobacillus stamsii TaxID=225347 RepID=A0ABU0G0T8_9BACI|nr:beta-phosphoglucomutase [Mesobacillus stamsii]MDQ0415769.1 beta-phosphoglucomutase [Mesobacillus stamsii]
MDKGEQKLNLKAVIFDLDGVITDTAEWHFLAWSELAKSIGIHINKEFNEELKGISRMESLERILDMGGIAHTFTEKEKVELAQRKNKYYVQLLTQMTPENIFPGIRKFLEELKKNHIKIGLASASKNAPSILDALQITEFFQVVVDPEKIAKGKPAPDIFLSAAEKLLVNPRNCVGIEDSIAGLQSIRYAGMFSIGVGTLDIMKEAGANLVLESTAELTLERLNGMFNIHASDY